MPPASMSSTSLEKKKKKKIPSTANSYRAYHLLAKYLPPWLHDRANERQERSSFIFSHGTLPASRCVEGKQAKHANRIGAFGGA